MLPIGDVKKSTMSEPDRDPLSELGEEQSSSPVPGKFKENSNCMSPDQIDHPAPD